MILPSTWDIRPSYHFDRHFHFSFAVLPFRPISAHPLMYHGRFKSAVAQESTLHKNASNTYNGKMVCLFPRHATSVRLLSDLRQCPIEHTNALGVRIKAAAAVQDDSSVQRKSLVHKDFKVRMACRTAVVIWIEGFLRCTLTP